MTDWKARIATRQNPTFEYRRYSPNSVYNSSRDDDDFFENEPVRIKKLTRQQSYIRKDEADLSSLRNSSKTKSQRRCLKFAVVFAIFLFIWTAVGLAIYYGIFKTMQGPLDSTTYDTFQLMISINDSFQPSFNDLNSSASISLSRNICLALNETFENISSINVCLVSQFSSGSILCTLISKFTIPQRTQNVQNILNSDFSSTTSIFRKRITSNVILNSVQSIPKSPTASQSSTNAIPNVLTTAFFLQKSSVNGSDGNSTAYMLSTSFDGILNKSAISGNIETINNDTFVFNNLTTISISNNRSVISDNNLADIYNTSTLRYSDNETGFYSTANVYNTKLNISNVNVSNEKELTTPINTILNITQEIMKVDLSYSSQNPRSNSNSSVFLNQSFRPTNIDYTSISLFLNTTKMEERPNSDSKTSTYSNSILYSETKPALVSKNNLQNVTIPYSDFQSTTIRQAKYTSV